MERLRIALRELMGSDSLVYRAGSSMLTYAALIGSESLVTSRSLLRMRGAVPGGPAVALQFSKLSYPFYIRPGTMDVAVALNNFVRQEYGAFQSTGEPRVLLDAGAYIGDTSAYFLSRYPTLRSIALEPTNESFHMAQINLRPYAERVTLHKSALTAHGRTVRMSGFETAARVETKGNVAVPSLSISQILAELPEKRIDILKMDIEGAEGPIFSEAPEAWLDRVGMIVVETHGVAITRTVLEAMRTNGWAAVRVRNLYFCRKCKKGDVLEVNFSAIQ